MTVVAPDVEAAARQLELEAEAHFRHGRLKRAEDLRRQARQMRAEPARYATEIAAAMPQTTGDAAVRDVFPKLVRAEERFHAATSELMEAWAEVAERLERAFALAEQASQGPAPEGDAHVNDDGDAVPAGPVAESSAGEGSDTSTGSEPLPPEPEPEGPGSGATEAPAEPPVPEDAAPPEAPASEAAVDAPLDPETVELPVPPGIDLSRLADRDES